MMGSWICAIHTFGLCCGRGRWPRLFVEFTLINFLVLAATPATTPVAFADNPEMAMDKMTDDELRAFREQKVNQLKERAREFRPTSSADGTNYSRMFFCTIYYTPKESGFTAERGFDATPTTASGLRGRKYSRDFLLAVKKEGFGRINEPVEGLNYIRWMSGNRYAFAETPVGRRGEVLTPRRSCAISSRNRFLRQHLRLKIKSQTVNDETGSDEWFVCDTGAGVHPLQIDLYWGEDEPHGAIGRHRARPRGTWMEYAFDVEVTAQR
jgi:hypothetical protein